MIQPVFLMLAVINWLISYVIGVRKKVHLLSGFRQEKVVDKGKLARIVGIYAFAVGTLMFYMSIRWVEASEELITIGAFTMAIGYIVLAIYVQLTMVER
ncbi:DUF3784 domain-containing protein [Marinococcus halophilus]|uniref:DUF3784 domain-containing protein n=1 Tax=Marinococcus halophilus TaxID=1371 RepID=A0A510Y4G4_MARHA|nr:DUF3784 domain-containing protein [Marinococcus halophilus]OZT80177.1 DUF3784 domain-containing protein [Marinococcus halophilus]GEK58229.1 hypothetical protein MHA01_11340 [Marinococcus halophilus]